MQPINFARISARDLVVWRGDRKVIAGLSLDAGAGECLHVAGANGSGKTTLLRVIAGFLHPEHGTIDWDGRPIAADRDAWGATFTYLGHSDGLKPELSARENLLYGVGLRRHVAKPEIEAALAQLGLAPSADRPAAVLSAGQRRRLAMARVVLTRTPLWILDEPYTNLDSAGVALVSTIIGGQIDAGGAVLMAAHQPPSLPNHSVRCIALA